VMGITESLDTKTHFWRCQALRGPARGWAELRARRGPREPVTRGHRCPAYRPARRRPDGTSERPPAEKEVRPSKLAEHLRSRPLTGSLLRGIPPV